MALDFNEMDLVNIKANKFDKLEHVFETLDNENETEILPEIENNDAIRFLKTIKPKFNSITGAGYYA